MLRFLGHLYAAEALISLDRISDAIAHLNPENVSDVSMGVLTSEQDQGQSVSQCAALKAWIFVLPFITLVLFTGSDKGEEPVEQSE